MPWVCVRAYFLESAMFISNTHKFIFVHLYKCAGTSVEVALAPTLRWNDILLGSTQTGERLSPIYRDSFGLDKHSVARTIRDTVGAELWDAYFTFATVRNPYAHAVSQYTFSMQHLDMGLRKSQVDSMTGQRTGRRDYDKWPWTYPGVQALLGLRQMQTSFGEFIRAPQMQSFEGFGDLKGQLCDSDGRLLVKRVVRMENLQAEWNGLCAELGLPGISLGRENPSTVNGFDHRLLYGPGDADLVRERYRDDFGFFGYSEALEAA
jgi:hypothetical protein